MSKIDMIDDQVGGIAVTAGTPRYRVTVPMIGHHGTGKSTVLNRTKASILYRPHSVFCCAFDNHSELEQDVEIYPSWYRDSALNMIVTLLKEKHTLKKKLEQSEKRCLYLGDLLNKRDKQMEELLDTNDELRERCEENDQRIEVQQNDLKEQQIVLQEFFLSLQFSNMPFKGPDNFQVATMGESTKHLWVLRRHQRNLASITKPLIKKIIRASTEAGIVSKNIGRCACKCSIASHDCASGFYKALLVSVGTSPCVLETFLQMMLDEFESEPCSRLCSQMLEECR
jgi:hypothetical protein